ncbi:hypothetical protein PRIPAC_82395, partial [Pristionchus pacificus]|uniref:G protein-coupled receptor n=1 Tax=Pristionchus pacificus TaxID=54126 RepID=A0A2A6CND3_PRIPA
IVTALLSALVIHLIITKTPEPGRPLARYLLLTQMSILVAGAGWAILDAPVLLLPLQAALCEGIVCGSDMGRHIGVVLIFQCMVHVAITVTFSIHYKYTTISRMAGEEE